MSNIIVEYDSIENTLPTINDLSKDCETFKGNVDSVAGDIESLSGKHDDCFGASIGVLDMFSSFITKLGSEYDAVEAVANTALSAFNNAEGKITADTDKIADLKWLLVYLGMDSEACDKLDFDKINTGKPDISKYEAYYKDTNADLSSSINSEIADMLLIEDGKGGYRVLTRSEIEEYIREQSKADTTRSAETTYTGGPSGSRTGATSSSSTSTKSSDGKTEGTLEERKEETEEKKEETEEKKEETPEEKTEETPEEKPEETPEEENPETGEEKPETEQPQPEQPAAPVAEVGGDPYVPGPAVSVPASNVSNIGISNVAPEVGSTVVPEAETPAETPETPATEPTVPEINNGTSPTSGTTRHNNTIPTTPTQTTNNNSGGSPAKFVFPALGAVAAAGAAGVGAKMYLDKKNGEEDDGEIEEYDDYESTGEDVDYTPEDDYNPNSSIQAPDSSWSLDNNIEDNKY